MKKILSLIIVIAMAAVLCLTASAKTNGGIKQEAVPQEYHDDPVPTGGAYDPDYFIPAYVLVDSYNYSGISFELISGADFEFARFTALNTDPHLYLASQPTTSVENHYAVIKYRTTSSAASIDAYMRAAEPHTMFSEIVNDGEWHYAFGDLEQSGSNWTGTFTRLDPLNGGALTVGDTIDIAWIALFADEEDAAMYVYYDGGQELNEGKMKIAVDGGTEPFEYNLITDDNIVEVKISLIDNPGLSSLRAVTSWSDKLTLIDARYDIYNEKDNSAMINLPDEYDDDYNPVWENVSSPFVFNWLSAKNTIYGDRTYVTLTFEVSEDAKDGDFLPVEIDVSAIDVFAGLAEPVQYTTVNGGISVVSYYTGDVDDDGVICNKDVVALFRAVSGTGVKINERAADFNLDKAVNNKDVAELFIFVSECADEIIYK